MNKTFPQILTTEAGYLFDPLSKLTTKADVVAFVNELGWDIKEEVGNVETLIVAISVLPNSVADLWKEVDALIVLLKSNSPNVQQIIDQGKKVGDKAQAVIKAVRVNIPAIKNLINAVKTDGVAMVSDGELLKRILDYLFYTYFQDYHPQFYSFLYLLGIAGEREVDNEKKVKDIYWKGFEQLFAEPIELANRTYEWETNFQGDEFLERMEHVLLAMSIPGGIYTQSDFIAGILERSSGSKEIRVPLYQKGIWGDNWTELDLNLSPLKDNAGLFLYPYAMGTVEIEDSMGNWELEIESDRLELGGGFGVEITPPAVLKTRKGLLDGDETSEYIDGKIEATFIRKIRVDEGIGYLYGAKGQNITSLSYKELKAFLFVKNKDGETDFGGRLEVKEMLLKVRFNQNNGNGFLKKVLPDGFDAKFDLGLGWTKKKGLYFKGGAGLEVSIPLDSLDNKVIDFDTLDLAVKATTDDGLKSYVAISGTVQFGPFTALMQKMGLQANLKFPSIGEMANENYGVFDAITGFKPPTSIGLDINAKGITGGGFLQVEDDSYAGVLSLHAKAIELTAFGILNTKLPNNQPGFSLLVSISVLFNPAIELGMGFRLEGVGGLLGVHRTYKVEALRAKLLGGSIDAIMFPEDPIEDAERIISDLRSIFPPLDKHYVVAPFLRLGWGKIIKLDLGVLFELPFNDRIMLLGSIGIKLPENKPRLVINIDVLGDFNFAEKYIRVEGVLRDSHINNRIPITGGFAFYTSWGNRPLFLFSVGGYHPRYKKPAQFPSIPRVGSVIKYGKALTLTVELYTAITSNSFQIGFRADFYAKAGGASITGYLGFDVLMYFNPFRFEADIAMGVAVKYKKKKLAGAALQFRLSGPGPWNAVGTAEFKFLCFTISGDFNHTWGSRSLDGPPSTIDRSGLLSDLQQSLSEISNWSAKKPEHVNAAEAFRIIEDDPGQLLLHPSGYLEVRQQVIPLNKIITKYGDRIVEGTPKFSIFIDGAQKGTVLKEYFSRGQFEYLTDEEKISTPDFELMDAGYLFGKGSDDDFEAIEDVEDLVSVESFIYEENILGIGNEARTGLEKKPAAISVSKAKQSGDTDFLSPKSKLHSKKSNLGDSFQGAGKGKGTPFIPNPGKGGPIRTDSPIHIDEAIENLGGKLISRSWKTSRGLLNRSRRKRRSEAKQGHTLMQFKKKLIFQESDVYVVATSGQSFSEIKDLTFSTFSEAKEHLQQHSINSEKAQVMSLESSKELALKLLS